MDQSLPGSTVHGILWARILEWIDMPFSKRFSWPRDRTQVSYIAGRFLTIWTTREARDHSQVKLNTERLTTKHKLPLGFLGGASGKDPTCQSRRPKRHASLVAQTIKTHLECRKPRFDHCVRKLPWRRECQPISVFLLWEVRGQGSLVVSSPCGPKEWDVTEQQGFLLQKTKESWEYW